MVYKYYVMKNPLNTCDVAPFAVAHVNGNGREVIDGQYKTKKGARAVCDRYNAKLGQSAD